MKYVSKMGEDPDGALFDTRVRAAMTQFTLGDDTGALETASAVRSASHAVERLRGRGADSRGISAGALDILIRLRNAPEKAMSMSGLARSIGVTARNVTGLVDTLERDGLARRVRDPHDRRSVLACITPAGLDWVESFRRPTQVALAALFTGFTPGELIQLRHFCLRLVDNQERIEDRLTKNR